MTGGRRKTPAPAAAPAAAPQGPAQAPRLDGGARLGAALAKLREPRPPAFEIPASQITRRAFDALNARSRAMRKALVKPQNAAALVAQIAELEAGDRLHAITPGHYVFGDLLMQLADRLRPAELTIATLSLSTDNVDALARRLDGGAVGRLRFVISDYFANTNKAIYEHMQHAASSRAWQIATVRTHAKIAIVDPPGLVIETSANLRSSQNIEQITAIVDPELAAFHGDWIDPLFARSPT